jgi:hypothetical protein
VWRRESNPHHSRKYLASLATELRLSPPFVPCYLGITTTLASNILLQKINKHDLWKKISILHYVKAVKLNECRTVSRHHLP